MAVSSIVDRALNGRFKFQNSNRRRRDKSVAIARIPTWNDEDSNCSSILYHPIFGAVFRLEFASAHHSLSQFAPRGR